MERIHGEGVLIGYLRLGPTAQRSFDTLTSEIVTVVGAMNNKELCLWCRRGLLAYVYNGVSLSTECLSGGKWLLYSTALWP